MKNFLKTYKDVLFSEFSGYIFAFLFLVSSFLTGFFFTENPTNKLEQEEFISIWINVLPYMAHYDYFSSYKFIGVVSLNMISLLLVIKTLITGKCSLFKGVKLSKVISVNMFLYILTLPFYLELCLTYILLLFVGFSCFYTGLFIWKKASERFNSACSCSENS